MNVSLSKKVAIVMGLTSAVVLTTLPAKAWNLICGVSIGRIAAQSEKKWDADSYAIKGMGLYYLAISDLQRIQLNEDGTVVNPRVLNGDMSATERAIQYLNESTESFTSALEIAKQEGLGDDKGLGLLSALSERTQSLSAQLSEGRIPLLEDFHATTQVVMEYTQYGIDLSIKHLGAGVAGHGEGGNRFRLQ